MTTTYTRKELDREARLAVRNFKHTLPTAIRRTVIPFGWQLLIGERASLLALFNDENGLHSINIAI